MIGAIPNILVAGSLVMDLVVSTNRFPMSGETVLGCGFSMAPGGKGANQAVQAARLGAYVKMAGYVGRDVYGETLIRSLTESGVDVSGIGYVDSLPTAVGNVQLELSNSGERQNRIIVVPGANMAWLSEDVDKLYEAIKSSDMVILQMEIPMWVNEKISHIAKSLDVPVLLNPAPAAPVPDSVYDGLSYIAPNETEAMLLTNVELKRDDSGAIDLDCVRKAADILHGKGVQSVIVTLGDNGSAISMKGKFLHIPPVKKLPAEDPTAAGDSFIGAFCTAVVSGKTVEDSMRFASTAAAITVSRLGAQPSLPNLTEVEALYRSQEN